MRKILALASLLFATSAFASGHVGDYAPGDTVDCNFGTVNPSTGASFTLAGTPVISVYKDNSTTESTAGVTLTADFDARTGLNHVRITTASDGTFYSAGSYFEAVITTGTVNSVSVVGQPICSFTLNKASVLRPATAGRTLVVDAAGLADANTVKLGPSGSGTAQTARDIGASVLLSSGTGTGQLSITSGVVSSNVTQFGGSAGTFASGRPEVNTTNINGTALSAGSCTGSIPALGIIDCGTAQAVTATTLQLRSAANFDTNDEIVGATCVITSATTGAGQSRTVTAYTNSTDTATVATWTTTPTGTVTYMCFGTSSSSGSVSIASGGITAASYASGAAPLMPTVAGRTLDVSATGEAGIDWANIGSPTTTVNLSGTTISTTQAVASVSGNVGGNVTGSVGSIASGGITSGSFSTTAGSYYPLGIIDQGTAQAATSTTLQLRSAATFADTELVGNYIVITGGTTGVGQVRQISAYTGSTDTATISSAWTTTPTGTITYQVLPNIAASAGGLTAAQVWTYGTRQLTDATNITSTGTTIPITSSRVDASVGAYQTGLTPLQPTVSGRTLDVSTGGEAGIDWANVGSPTTTVNLSGTTIGTATALGTDSVNSTSVATTAVTELQTGLATSSALSTLSTTIGANGAGLTAIPWNSSWNASVTADALAALNSLTISEPAAKPSWSSSTLAQWIAWIGAWTRNEVNQTSTQKILRNDADNANIVTCAVSDDGSTFSVQECSP